MTALRLLLGAMLLACLSTVAAPASWTIPDAPYRAVIKLSYAPEVPAAGIAITLPEFGATMEKLADVVLTDTSGAILPVFPVWRGNGQEALLLAKELSKDQEYYVYFGGNRQRAGQTWAPVISLLMETRRLPASGALENWSKMEAAWRSATETDGAGWVRYIYQGVNPYGENHHFLTHYTGYLRTEKLKELKLYTVSSDASFVLVNGNYAFGWPGEHGSVAHAKSVNVQSVPCAGPLTRIDYYHAKTGAGSPTMVLGWQSGAKFDAVPDDLWVHPGAAKMVRLEQADGLPVPVPTIKVRSYIGYANQWLYEVGGSLPDDVPAGWTVQWKFSDGATSTQREFTRVIIGGSSLAVSVKLQQGRDEFTGLRRVNFTESLTAASVKDPDDVRRYVEAMTRENLAELPIATLRSYINFLQAIRQDRSMAPLADAWLKRNPDFSDALWLPSQLSRLRAIAQTDPHRALAELRNIPPGPRAQYAAALDLFELDLLVFFLADPVAVSRAQQINMRDPKADLARVALVRAGDFYRLQGRYPEAIAQYQQAQRSIVEESSGRKLPAQDRAYSITINDLLERDDVTEAEQKLIEWEAHHPMAKLDSDFLILRCRVLIELGRAREALAEIESFAKLQPDTPFQIDADFYRARALFELGKKDEARKIWNEIVTKYPQHALVEQSREWAAKR